MYSVTRSLLLSFSPVLRHRPPSLLVNNPITKMSTLVSSKKYFLLNYKYVDNVVEKRAPLRSAHLSLSKKYLDAGKLVMGGAFADPVDGAAIVFKVDTKTDVEAFVNEDPYVSGGIVTRWEIREWTVVVDGNSSSSTPQ